MLLQLNRVITREFGEDDATAHSPIAIDPKYVAALFENVETPGVIVLRMSDGRGIQVAGSFDDLIGQMPGLLRFARSIPHGDEPASELPIGINPRFVAALFESNNSPQVLLVQLPDGRRLQIKGTYAEIYPQIEAGQSDAVADSLTPRQLN